MKIKQPPVNKNEKLRAIAYSMDLLIPGIYIWCPWFTLKIGGSNPDDNPYRYPGMIHSFYWCCISTTGLQNIYFLSR